MLDDASIYDSYFVSYFKHIFLHVFIVSVPNVNNYSCFSWWGCVDTNNES